MRLVAVAVEMGALALAARCLLVVVAPIARAAAVGRAVGMALAPVGETVTDNQAVPGIQRLVVVDMVVFVAGIVGLLLIDPVVQEQDSEAAGIVT
jgi:hypothetical protein